jgi:hypothetical protein
MGVRILASAGRTPSPALSGPYASCLTLGLMLSHVMLHVVLCNSPQAWDAPVPVSVRVSDRTDRAVVDQVFDATGAGDSRTVAFEVPFGVYRLQSNVSGSNCGADGFVAILPDHNRNITQTLVDAGSTTPTVVPLMLDGTGPASFHAAKPQFVTFDASAAACGYPVPPPIPARVVFEHDGDAYYASMYPSQAFLSGKLLVVALQLQTPDHGYQYVRVFNLMRVADRAFPVIVRFGVDQKMMDILNGKATDTLFCPPFNEAEAV